MGLLCPNCSEPVVIKEDRKRVICTCGASVDRDGTAAVKCGRCGARHRSEKAIQFCEVYKAWYDEGAARVLVMPPFPAGTTDPGPWPLVDFNTIRDAILRRDDHTCQDCGYDLEERGRLRTIQREELTRRGGPDGLSRRYIKAAKEIPEPPDLEVHHILPQRAGGLHNPSNLITLCSGGPDTCHVKRHNLIGGFTPYPDVLVALMSSETTTEARRAILVGEHPIVVKAREERAYNTSTVKGKRFRDTRRRIREGRQDVLL